MGNGNYLKKFTCKLDCQVDVELRKFQEIYYLETELDSEIVQKINGSNMPKQCRFCLESEPTVRFKNKSHLVPQLLGRARTISLDECDSCNAAFAKHDDELGKFTSHFRSLMQHNKKSGPPPTFKTNSGTKLEPISNILDENKDRIIKSIQSENNRVVLLTQDTNQTEVKITNDGIKFALPIDAYIPIDVFRSLLKVGFSLIDRKSLPNFEIVRRILVTSAIKSSENPIFSLHTWTIPLFKPFYPFPVVRLYGQRDDKVEYVSKLMSIYFGNQIWQIGLPSDQNIKSKFTILRPHPIFEPPKLILNEATFKAFCSSFYNNTNMGNTERQFGLIYNFDLQPVIQGDIEELNDEIDSKQARREQGSDLSI